MNKLIYLVIVTIAAITMMGCAEGVDVTPIATDPAECITLYKNGNNEETIEVLKRDVDTYTANWEWSIEPTTLMYTADGRQSYIWNSEVEVYKAVGWSTNPPVTLYGPNDTTMSCLVEEKQAYLDTGKWFATAEEARPKAVFTYNVFTKSNLTVAQISKILTGTKIQAYAQDFYDMEQEYNVNALFCLSVACLESGGGAKNANRNNFFGFRGNSGWMAFNTPRDGIFYFGKLMNKSLYYGKSIEQIGVIYCDGSWAPYVKRLMQERWNKLN